MPELPEVEITARLLDRALAGAEIEYARAPGINALRSFDPPLAALEGASLLGVRRRGKHLIIDTHTRPGEGGPQEGPPRELSLLIHLMSAGRLQLYEKPAGPRDRTSRLLLGLRAPREGVIGGEAGLGGWAAGKEEGLGVGAAGEESARAGALRAGPARELRLREFGSKQAAWVKLLSTDQIEDDDALTGLGPEAWPDPPAGPAFAEILAVPRPLHSLLRDQHVIAGIGRSWVDEILWKARLSPYRRACDLKPAELVELRLAIVEELSRAIEHYEALITLPIPDKLPMPLEIHRHEGEPCPRCGSILKSVHFEDYVIAYCPTCQTEGRVLKDRRLSRLLK